LAFDAPGTLGAVSFAANDVLEYDPVAKVWSKAYQGSIQGDGWTAA
jgi:hypothetical protein